MDASFRRERQPAQKNQWRETIGPTTAAPADSFAERPLYCDLISHAETVLEHNITLDVPRTYALWAIQMYGQAGERIATVFPPFRPAPRHFIACPSPGTSRSADVRSWPCEQHHATSV